MFVSIGVAAYFVGTSVLLVQENERKTGAYRCAGVSSAQRASVLGSLTGLCSQLAGSFNLPERVVAALPAQWDVSSPAALHVVRGALLLMLGVLQAQ